MSDAAPETKAIGHVATVGVLWSVLQSWSTRLSTFVIFVLLAKFLTPSEYGLASAALLCFLLIGIVAEFGFGEAIVQRRGLVPQDINLPFFVAIAASLLLSLAAAFAAPVIERRFGTPGLAPFVVALSGVAPITTIGLFQEYSFRRELAFRPLALRVIVANLTAGGIAILLAYLGAGTWSLVAQAYLTAIVGAIWLWSRPLWKPTLEIRFRSFVELTRFGMPIVAMRVTDFVATRLVDLVILYKFGIAALGIFAVGARLYQTLMHLLQGALNDVSLSVLSRVSHDRERIAGIYMRTLVLAGFLCAPLFVLFAALSPEICAVLFEARWAGVDRIAEPLLLVGALQAVQFLNGPYINARGKPGIVFAIGLFKYGAIFAGLLLLPTPDPVSAVRLFALLQLTATPLSFWSISRELRIPLIRIAVTLMPSAIGCAAGLFAVAFARASVTAVAGHPLVAGTILGALFALCYTAIAIPLGWQSFKVLARFLRDRRDSLRGEAGKADGQSVSSPQASGLYR